MSTNYTFQSYDLDLDRLEHTEDPSQIVGMVGQLVDADSDFKIFPARQWIENFLYYAGQRDVYSRFSSGTVQGSSLLTPGWGQGLYNQTTRMRRRIAKTFKAIQVQASNATRQRPSIKVWPEGDDESSNTKAKLANILIDYLWDVDHEDDLNYEAMLWALMTPTVARKDYLDYSFNATRIHPVMDSVRDPMSGQPMSIPRRDADGVPIVQQLPWNKTAIIPAFRLFFNASAGSDNEIDFIGHIATPRIGWIRENFNKNEEGYYPENLEKIKKGTLWKFTPIMAMESSIKQLTFGAFRAFRNWNYSNSNVRDGVTYVNMFTPPCPTYPMGREICIANAELLYNGPSRAYRANPMNWHDYGLLSYEKVPGRMWGTTYAEKITDINRAYEQGRSEFDQLRRTFSKPKMALPIGAQIDRDTILGDEQVLRYNPFGPDGGKPEYLNAPQPPTTIIDDIKMTAQEFVEISGLTEIKQGIRPQGVTTYRGLEVLREEADNAASNLIRMYENFIQRGQINKLENIRKSLTEIDPTLTAALKIYKKMNQYITDVEIQDFLGDELSGYVKVEPMSSIGKSKLAVQEKLLSMAQMMVLGDIANDPDLNQEFKRKMDVVGFEKPQNKQVMFARYENELMLSSEKKQTIINPPVLPWHDDAIHIREVENLLNDPTLQSKAMVIQSLVMHREAHLQSQANKMQAQMLAQMNPMAAPASGMPGHMPQGGQRDKGVMFGPETGFISQPSGEMV